MFINVGESFILSCKKQLSKSYLKFNVTSEMGLDARRKPVSGGLRKTKAQIKLRILSVWSVPLLFA